LRQENSYFSIGERCNANGSKRWRELQEKNDWDGCVSMGREQISEGSNALDVCTAFVGRDERAEMDEVVKFALASPLPTPEDAIKYVYA
jgi:5-methyltetrahydrofolate--homocysteine methyltransferase